MSPNVCSVTGRLFGRASKFRSLAIGALFVIAGCAPQISTEEQMENAQLALRRNDHSTAQTILDDVLKRHPDHSQAMLFRAQLARDMGDDQAALAFVTKVPDTPAKLGSPARFVEGSILLGMNMAAKAESKLLRSIELNPAYVHPHETLLRLYLLQRRKTEILRELEALSRFRALQLPELALQLTAGEPMIDAKDAIPQLESYVTADPDDMFSQLALATYYREAVRPGEAIAVLRQLISAHPEFSRARGVLVEILVDQQDLPGAAKSVESVELSDNSPVELWRSAGIYLLAQEEWERAAQSFAVVIPTNSLDRATFRRLGLALQRMGDHQSAVMALKRTSQIAQLRDQCETLGIQLTRNQVNSKGLTELADLLADLEEPDRASVFYEQAILMDPAATKAREGLQRLQTQKTATITQLLAKIPRRTGPMSLKVREAVTPAPPSTSAGRTVGSVIRFRDDHERTGMNFSYFNGESGFRYLIESMGGGVGVIDFDHDDWPDLFFPQGNDMFSNSPEASKTWHDQLFRNVGGTRFVAIPREAGVGDPGYGQGVAVGDFDNDGFDDLVITNYGACTVLINRGDGTFEDVTARSGLNRKDMSTSAGWADFDQDGLTDLFIVNYVDGLKVCRNDLGEISACSPSNHIGVDDRLYRNLGDGRFEDVTARCGLVPGGKGLGLLLADLDDDGLVDAFVSNDTSPNFFYRNRSRPGEIKFVEEGLLSGMALGETGIAQAGMGIACGDMNGDQRLDLYVTYFHREANGLYLNRGDGLFEEATRAAGLYHPTLNMLGFGTQAVDFDLDGHLELVVANGHIDDQRFRGIPWKMPPQLFVSQGGLVFEDRSRDAGEYFRGEYLGRAVVRVDWNRDGRPDLAIVHQDRPAALLTNTTESTGNFLEIKLRSATGNRNAIGARVNVTCQGQTQRADVTSGDGFYCGNEQKLIFGLGDCQRVDRLEIVWPGGMREVHTDLPAKSRWIVVQSSKLLNLAP